MIGNMDVQCHNTRINANIDFARCKYDIGLTKHRLSQEGNSAMPCLFPSENYPTIDLRMILRSSSLKMSLYHRRILCFSARACYMT